MPSTKSFENPLGVDSIQDFLGAILEIVLVISIPIIVFFLIYAGFQYVAARGNPEKLQTAHRALLFGVIGAVIVLGGFAIVTIVTSLVESF
ncbi:MAG: Mbov_0395 family pilin-like conjugal transfer protein [Patescibacteria group bacterium]